MTQTVHASMIRRTNRPCRAWIAGSALLGLFASASFAAENRFVVNFGDRFQHEGGKSTWQTALLAAAILLAIGIGGWLALRLLQARQRRLANSPRQLFKDLCNAHRLSFHERRMMTRLALHLRLSQPAMLFMDPQLWTERRLGPAWAARLTALKDLREKLFTAK